MDVRPHTHTSRKSKQSVAHAASHFMCFSTESNVQVTQAP